MPLGAYRINGIARYEAVAAAGRPAMYVIAENQAKVSTAQSKFGGASAVFDGSADTVRAVTLDTDLLAGDFTMECWFRLTTTAPQYQTFFMLGTEQPGRIGFYCNYSTLNFDSYSSETPDISMGTISANTWYHVAAVRSGSTITVYLDGVSKGTGSRSGTVGNRFGIILGADGYYNAGTNGYVDEVRVSKIARYTGAFTPSSTAFTNDDDTVLLLHMNGTNNSTTFTDDAPSAWVAKTMIALNNAQVSTAQYKFGTASAYNGPVLGSDLPVFTAASNSNFTLECWVRVTTGNTVNKGILYLGQEYFSRFVIYLDAGGSLRTDTYSTGYGNINSSTTLSVNTWYHVAYVRNSGTATLYIDGVSKGTSGNAGSTDFGNTGHWGFCDAGIYVDEVRISNSARYTSNFTPASSAFSTDGNTLRLYHCDGTNGSTDFPDAS